MQISKEKDHKCQDPGRIITFQNSIQLAHSNENDIILYKIKIINYLFLNYDQQFYYAAK